MLPGLQMLLLFDQVACSHPSTLSNNFSTGKLHEPQDHMAMRSRDSSSIGHAGRWPTYGSHHFPGAQPASCANLTDARAAAEFEPALTLADGSRSSSQDAAGPATAKSRPGQSLCHPQGLGGQRLGGNQQPRDRWTLLEIQQGSRIHEDRVCRTHFQCRLVLAVLYFPKSC